MINAFVSGGTLTGARGIGARRKEYRAQDLERRLRLMTDERLVEDYAGTLTIAQVHEALAYYYRHQSEIEGYLEADERAGEELMRLSRERLAPQQPQPS